MKEPTLLQIIRNNMPTEPVQKLTPYHQNFIKAVKKVMADAGLETTKEAAEYLGIPYQGLWKVMDGTNKPSVENCIKVLVKGKFNANWLFLNTGEPYQQAEVFSRKILKELTDIKALITQSL